MNGGYSFASSYRRIERVRSNVFKSGVRRSCALRLNLLVAITRVVTGFPTLFIALTRSVLFPFNLFLPKFHPVSIFHTSFFKVTISVGHVTHVPLFFYSIFYIYSVFYIYIYICSKSIYLYKTEQKIYIFFLAWKFTNVYTRYANINLI